MVGRILLVLLYCSYWTGSAEARPKRSVKTYDRTYPITAPLENDGLVTFRIGIIADLDKKSKSSDDPNVFNSYLKKGFLVYHTASQQVEIIWDKDPSTQLTSAYNYKGRGMELSELIVYDGRLLTFDDRSGIIFEVLKNKVVPWAILADGDGHLEKGFKAEWATVKDEVLYVGSTGKEWTTPAGEFMNSDPLWVKTVNIHGEVQHLNWVDQFKAIRNAIGIRYPGYIFHEAGVWSSIHQRWNFLPRRCSKEKYNETTDELKGCNVLIIADSSFRDVRSVEVTQLLPKLGFSSFKFVPGTRDEVIVALKTTEYEGETSTYITAFRIDGKSLLEDTLVEYAKYEGIEFI